MNDPNSHPKAAGPVVRSIDGPAIERILRAVGPQNLRESVNREDLAEALNRALRVHERWSALDRENTSDQQIRKKLAKLVTLASYVDRMLTARSPWNRISILLREEGEREASSTNVWPVDEGLGAPVLEIAIEAIGALGRRATRILQRQNLALGWRQKREPTANYWLMGEGLPGIFSHLVGKRSFGISRSTKDGGLPGGPGLRFVQAVLTEARMRNRNGQMWGPEAIESAFRHFKIEHGAKGRKTKFDSPM